MISIDDLNQAHNLKFLFLEFNWVIIVQNHYQQTKKGNNNLTHLMQRKKKLDIVCEEIKFHSAVRHAQSFLSI